MTAKVGESASIVRATPSVPTKRWHSECMVRLEQDCVRAPAPLPCIQSSAFSSLIHDDREHVLGELRQAGRSSMVRMSRWVGAIDGRCRPILLKNSLRVFYGNIAAL